MSPSLHYHNTYRLRAYSAVYHDEQGRFYTPCRMWHPPIFFKQIFPSPIECKVLNINIDVIYAQTILDPVSSETKLPPDEVAMQTWYWVQQTESRTESTAISTELSFCKNYYCRWMSNIFLDKNFSFLSILRMFLTLKSLNMAET